jgi:hypothetical protein
MIYSNKADIRRPTGRPKLGGGRLTAYADEATHPAMRALAREADRRDLSLHGLATQLGRDPRALGRTFLCKTRPRYETVKDIAAALGYPAIVAHALLDEKKEPGEYRRLIAGAIDSEERALSGVWIAGNGERIALWLASKPKPLARELWRGIVLARYGLLDALDEKLARNVAEADPGRTLSDTVLTTVELLLGKHGFFDGRGHPHLIRWVDDEKLRIAWSNELRAAVEWVRGILNRKLGGFHLADAENDFFKELLERHCTPYPRDDIDFGARLWRATIAAMNS